MSGIVEGLLVVGIVVYVIGRQVIGEPLRGKRLIVLPLVLTIIGVVDLSHSKVRAGASDVVIIALEVVVCALIGLAMGRAVRLEERRGHLWGQLPPRALWWWGALVASRLAFAGIAYGIHAHVAASGSALLLGLGVNRLAQAVIVLARAVSAGVPFAPEKDGVSFLEGLFAPTGTAQTPRTSVSAVSLDKTASPPRRADRIDWTLLAGRAQTFLDQRAQVTEPRPDGLRTLSSSRAADRRASRGSRRQSRRGSSR